MKKRIIFLVALAVTSTIVAQRELPEGWDHIVFDDKPAYININTGEISRTYPKGVAKVKSTYAQSYTNTDYIAAASANSHTVQRGETLSIIARKYNVNLRRLYDLNPSIDFNKLAVGQIINTGDASLANSSDYHVVRTGETLYSISKGSGVTVSELKRLNNLRSNTLKIGQKIRVN